VVDLDDEGDPVGVAPRDEPSVPSVEAMALQPPSIASSTSGRVEVLGLGANDAAAECSMPWSTGRIER
jgi:hypothetical protein